MGHDRQGGEDEDRRAILARRQRFVALALAGLGGTSGACAGKGGQSEHPEEARGEDGEDGEDAESPGGGVDPIDMPPPRPPGEFEPRRRKWTTPQSCLRVKLSDEEAP